MSERMEWHSIEECLPEVHDEEDYWGDGCRWQISEPVLVWDGETYWVAVYEIDDEGPGIWYEPYSVHAIKPVQWAYLPEAYTETEDTDES